MDEVATLEFPFVQVMPKRQKSKLVNLWESFREIRAAVDKHGSMVPQSFAAELLGISRQRVAQLVEAGQLEVVQVHTAKFVTEDSLVALAQSERKNGRPFKVPQTDKELWSASHRAAKK